MKAIIQKLSYLFIAMVSIHMHAYGQSAELNRGVVAITSGDHVFVSWRLFSSDPDGVGFNVYRSNEVEQDILLTEQPITQGTNYEDKTADLSKSNTYTVVPVSPEGDEVSSANARSRKVNKVAASQASTITVNLRNGPEIHFAWVGDLDGDGDYDYVVDRLAWGVGTYLEAYTNDGTFLWDIDYGPNSENMDNISPGSATIDVGHWDGVTVADLDGDGKAEVITKVARGVRLGDGSVWPGNNDNEQWLAVLDGETGAPLGDARIPDDYIAIGPVSAQLGVGNGNNVFLHAKNRNSSGSFNIIDACYVYEGEPNFKLKWNTTGGGPQGHQIRVVDVNEDGVDDLAHIGLVRDGKNGTVLYQLENIVHGDRFQIGKFDPNREGLQGYGIQQVNPFNIIEYYYDASTGQMLWTNPGGYDNGRGNAADIDPNYPGYEVWSFEGIYNAPTHDRVPSGGNDPWPNFRLWWDGDDGSELFDDGKIQAWNYTNNSVERLVTTSQSGATGSYRGAPLFYGDFLGDWREEIIMRNSGNNQLIIFTTDIPTSISRPSLMEDRYYRNDLTVKGYMQSHHTSFYLGEGGATCPPTAIEPFYQIDGGEIIEGSDIAIQEGQELVLWPKPWSKGSWNWEGCGITGEEAKQTINPDGPCRVIATYTNECGGVSTSIFNISIDLQLDTAYYKLRNRGTGLYLDSKGTITDGDPTYQSTSSTGVYLLWQMVKTDNNTYQIQNVASRMYLDGMDRATNGAEVAQQTDTTGVSSEWYVTKFEEGYYQIQNEATKFFLDGMGHTEEGSSVGQWPNTDNVNAQWELVLVPIDEDDGEEDDDEEVLGENGSESFQIYPNPTSGKLTIQLPSNYTGDKVANLYDVSGKLEMNHVFSELTHEMDVEHLPAGSYILRTWWQDQLIVERVVKK